MQSHSTGAVLGTRIGALVTAQGFSLDNTNNLTGVNLKLCTVEASAAKPVAIRVRAVVVVADTNSSTATLSVGTASAGTQFLNAVDLKAAAGTNYKPTNDVIIAVANTDIWAVRTLAGTVGVGQSVVLVELAEVNITQPTTLGA